MSDLVGNPEDRVSCDVAHILSLDIEQKVERRTYGMSQGYEPWHEKTCFSGFLTRSDTNSAIQQQKKISDFGSRWIVLSMWCK